MITFDLTTRQELMNLVDCFIEVLFVFDCLQALLDFNVAFLKLFRFHGEFDIHVRRD